MELKQETLFTPTVYVTDAILSGCGRYRYSLTRIWDKSLPVICWLMLNPSTADANQDEPTIRKCIGFARIWGAGGIAVVNLFALRATDPRELIHAGPGAVAALDAKTFSLMGDNLNDNHIIAASDTRRLIAAWGTKGALMGRDKQVMKLLQNRRVECLRTTKDGHPEHPLYVPYLVEPKPFKIGGQS